MPKTKNYRRNNKSKFNKNYKKSGKTKNVITKETDRRKRNLKFIKRSKEAEDSQRRQKLIEDKYKLQNKLANDSMSEDVEDDEEENPYDQLLMCFKNPNEDNLKNKAIESSSDEEVDQTESESENEQIDEELPLDEEELSLVDEDLESEIQDDDMSDESNSNVPEALNGNIKTAEDPEIIDEEELDNEIEEEETSNNCNNSDPYSIHLDKELSEEHINNLVSKPPNIKKAQLSWPELGNMHIEISSKDSEIVKQDTCNKKKLLSDDQDFASEGKIPTLIDLKHSDLTEHYVKSQLVSNIILANADHLGSSSNKLTKLQSELFSIINNYQDVYYPQRTLNNAEEIRFIYCLHALNHMLKMRTKILHHNAKLSATNTKKSLAIIPDSYRDQGLVRPKVLIVVPFRDSAYKVVNMLIKLFFGEKEEKAKSNNNVINYKRFVEEYTGDTIHFPKRNPKPDDYEQIFSGNSDDTFRIGISLTKKSIKLYTEFYSSDILIASPLGLRMIVGAPGDEERDYDFLTSIELLVLDQAELFLAQNWDHLLHVLDHLHLQPQSVRNTDFSRVRPWCLNGLSKFYRQTLLFTSHELPEFRSLFNNKCTNYRGKVRIANPVIYGSIRHVIVQIPQVFHKIEVTSVQTSFDTRFKYFINEILPQFKNPSMAHCMIYIPSYFDYVRIRNYMKLENMNFVQICEYSKDAKIARARDMFYHSSAHFLLYSERAHFFRRTRIKGIRHLIMYQPTFWPHFYSEMINLMQDANQNSRDGLESSMSVTVLYTKYDILQLAGIIGTEKAAKICNSGKTSHMFMTGE